MATALRSALLFSKTIKITDAVFRVSHFQPVSIQSASALNQLIVIRHGSFFNKKNAESMWDSVTGVSNQGRKRGRASRGKLLRRVNLNIGQKMGHGKTGLIFPGLSTNITGKEKFEDLGIRRLQKSEPETQIEEKSSKIQKQKQMRKIDPLDRGFTGKKLAGRKVEPPDPIGDYDFSDFDAYVLENKLVGNVTASQGKVFSTSVLVAVGNRKGLVGLGLGKGSTTAAALSSAKNKAVQQLVYVDLYNGHTAMHDFGEKFHRTSVIVKQAPEGAGLSCHPALKIICKLIGIKDIRVQSEGKVRNYLNLCRAFISGISKTRSHQDIANELGHHIVEYRREKDFYPILIASPSENAQKTDFKKHDGFTFETFCFGDRLPLNKSSKKPSYWKSAGFKKKKLQEFKQRNQSKATINRMVVGIQPEFKQRQQE